MSGTARDRLISRHHCELAIDPPTIRVQDLGSQNGTYINGKPVEAIELALMESAKAPGGVRLDQMVRSGDMLTIGGTTFQVDIVECPPKGMDGGRPVIWKEGETAKKDCPIDCSGK
jgi:pSer/pThr/pTyr-binding forkhead associated (FHA) protein